MKIIEELGAIRLISCTNSQHPSFPLFSIEKRHDVMGYWYTLKDCGIHGKYAHILFDEMRKNA